MIWVLGFFVLAVAYFNGANDNFKGVATLYGSKTGTFGKSLIWAAVATFGGSLTSIILSERLIKVFSGSGLIPSSALAIPGVMTAVVIGAVVILFLATQFGMPTSTTHAITGGLIGVAAATQPHLPWLFISKKFFVPLLFSPIIAIIIATGLYYLFATARRRLGITRETCVCLDNGQFVPVRVAADGTLMTSAEAGNGIVVASHQACVERYQGEIMGVTVQTILDRLHYLSAFAVSFSRGLNDTPKIAALLLTMTALGLRSSTALIALAMLLGGIFSVRRVAETMSHKITPMTPGQGFSANLTTSLLVASASLFGLPVSTTHVSVGSLFGVGAHRGDLNQHTVRNIILTWLITLPGAALISFAAYHLLIH